MENSRLLKGITDDMQRVEGTEWRGSNQSDLSVAIPNKSTR